MDNYETLLVSAMEEYFGEDTKRIQHAKAVLQHAQTIMQHERGERKVIVPAALLHDIDIKECERKYNAVRGDLQEKEGPPIADNILRNIHYPIEHIKEILEIIGNHHSRGNVKTINFQILYEADWLVNLNDDYTDLPIEKKETIIRTNFKTKTGLNLAKELFLTKK